MTIGFKVVEATGETLFGTPRVQIDMAVGSEHDASAIYQHGSYLTPGLWISYPLRHAARRWVKWANGRAKGARVLILEFDPEDAKRGGGVGRHPNGDDLVTRFTVRGEVPADLLEEVASFTIKDWIERRDEIVATVEQIVADGSS